MIRVGILGATGYAGAELIRLLAGHPEVEISVTTSKQYAGIPFSEVYPSMKGVFDQPCMEYDFNQFEGKVDVVFMALPHKLPMNFAPDFIKHDIKVIDLSADFRFRDVNVYEQHYQPHTSRKLSESAVYGLAEINTVQIETAGLVGNPGCYPTSTLLPLVPLLQNRLIRKDMIVVDSKSGVSGAGRSVSLGTHFCEVNESFKAYKVGNHRHTPEIEENLSAAAGESVRITFVPHLVPMTRGMLTTSYSEIKEGVSEETIRECLHSCYEGKYFIRICKKGDFPTTGGVRTTNFCDIGLALDEQRKRLILVSAIDNLVKGAAGQAVQNMNIMMGLDEKTGLTGLPLPV